MYRFGIAVLLAEDLKWKARVVVLNINTGALLIHFFLVFCCNGFVKYKGVFMFSAGWKYVVLCVALFVVLGARGQETVFRDTTLHSGYFVRSIKIDDELFPHVRMATITVLPPVRFKSKRQKRRYTRMVRNIKKVYPYSLVVKGVFLEVHQALDTMQDKKQRRRYIKSREAELKEKFEGKLRKLTFSQGRLLIKLVDRETGYTTYEVVKELKGSVNAFFWQGIARIFGSNLKSEYDEKGDDWMIEDILIRIENGQL